MYIDMSLYGTNFIGFQATDLGNIMLNKTSSTMDFPSNTSVLNKNQIVYPNPTVIKETDIVCEMSGFPKNGDQIFTFGPKIQNIYLTGNMPQTSANPMSYSTDGYTFYGLNYTNIFTPSAGSYVINSIKYNGRIWVAASNRTNTLAYSYDGLFWRGLGTSIFSNQSNWKFTRKKSPLCQLRVLIGILWDFCGLYCIYFFISQGNFSQWQIKQQQQTYMIKINGQRINEDKRRNDIKQMLYTYLQKPLPSVIEIV